MNLKRRTDRQRGLAAAIERAELYFVAHPGSPSAARRPTLWKRSGTWVAVSGPNLREGIVGLGATVETALRAFDARYLASRRPGVVSLTIGPGDHSRPETPLP